jgi:serine/threonine-protein kinase
MAYIPCGPFRMGSDEDIESPRHTVFLSAYCIDLTEATNASWQACVAGSGCTPPAYPNSRTRTPYYGNAAFDEYPVIYITWLQAGAYCAWAGRRLPTEAEWEKAARGGCEVVPPETCGTEDEPPFPWGTATISCDLAHYGPCSPDDTDGAFSHPAGASPYGVLNTAGNVWEWVSDWYFGGYLDMCPDPCVDPTGPASGPGRLLRGGAFWNENHPGDVSVSATSRNGPWNEETKNEDDIGVRCVRSLP